MAEEKENKTPSTDTPTTPVRPPNTDITSDGADHVRGSTDKVPLIIRNVDLPKE